MEQNFWVGLQIALVPCSPFSVTTEIMRESARLARREDVRLHTHLAETLDEEAFCLKMFVACARWIIWKASAG